MREYVLGARMFVFVWQCVCWESVRECTRENELGVCVFVCVHVCECVSVCVCVCVGVW